MDHRVQLRVQPLQPLDGLVHQLGGRGLPVPDLPGLLGSVDRHVPILIGQPPPVKFPGFTIYDVRRCAGTAVTLLLVAMLGPVAGATAKRRATRVETPVRSTSPDAATVRESYVQLYAPLPAADG